MNIILLLYMDNELNNIKKLYEKMTYFDQYGGSLILVIIFILCLSVGSFFSPRTSPRDRGTEEANIKLLKQRENEEVEECVKQ